MERPLALVVDGDPAVRALVREVLEERGVMTLGASTASEALEALRTRPLGILLIDSSAPGVRSADLPGAVRRLRPAAAVVSLLPEADHDSALRAIREGAFDALSKPLDEESLRLLTERLLRQVDVLEERKRLRDELRERSGYQRLVGRSESMERLRERLERIASTAANVMFTGEVGVGKELAARTLHAMSPLAERSFVTVDCASMPPTSLEAELFGAGGGGAGPEGADLQRVVFLDSVLDLPEPLQERLSGELDGGGRLVRVLSSTSRDPRRAVEEGRFAEELYRRLSAAVLDLPPLRERVEDVALLARHFIDSIRAINNLPPIQLTPESLAVLERYTWPGNVGELRNAVEQAVILAVDGTIRARDLPARIQRGEEGEVAPDAARSHAERAFKAAKREVVERFERQYLRDVLDLHRGNVTAAAGHAGMLRSALQRLLRKYSIRSADFRRRPKTL